MNLITLTLGTIVDRALQEVRNQYEVGRYCVRADSLSDTDNEFSLNVDANISDILEFGSELMLISDKSSNTNPIYTVIRGWHGTTAVAYLANEPGLINPTFSRKAAADGAMRSFTAIRAGDLPILRTTRYTSALDPEDTTTGIQVIELPTSVVDVWYVRKGGEDIPRWRYLDTVSTPTPYSTGQILTLPLGWDSAWSVDITYETAYRWDSYPADPDEDSEIEVPEGAEWLPSCYSTAWMLAGREVSRADIDRSEEYVRTVGLREGITRSIVREAWQTFYRKLDEARRVNPPLPTRPYVSWVM